MSDPQYEIRVWLHEQLAAAGHGAKGRLARHLGVRPDAITRILNTDSEKEIREIKAREIVLMAEFFGSEPPGSVPQTERTVRIRGKAGAGPDGAVLFAPGDSDYGEVPAPIGATETTVALEVEGSSMRGVANDGWLIFYDDMTAPLDEHMGELCVCWLEDDRVLVKTPYPGRAKGLFDLESVNAPTMRDAAVRYFAFVTDIKPRISAQRFIKRNPLHVVKDVTTEGRARRRA